MLPYNCPLKSTLQIPYAKKSPLPNSLDVIKSPKLKFYLPAYLPTTVERLEATHGHQTSPRLQTHQ